jgi:hypothetical protein
MRRLAYAPLALLMSLSSLACAQTTLPTAGQYFQPGGNLPTSAMGVEPLGYDSSTHLRCMVGETSTCQLQTNASGGGGGNAAAGLTGSAVPTSASYEGFNSGGNLVGVSVANPLPVTGGASTGVVGALGTPTSATLGGGQDSATSTTLDALTVDASDGGLRIHEMNFPAFTFSSVYLNTLDQNSAGILAAAQAPLAAQASLGIDIGSVGILPNTTGGLSTYSEIVPANTTSVAVDTSPGSLMDIEVGSNSATPLSNPIYVKFYNVAQGSVTCGTPTPQSRYIVTGGSNIQIGGGVVGAAFSTAITMCITGGIADNDTTNPTASTYVITIHYK